MSVAASAGLCGQRVQWAAVPTQGLVVGVCGVAGTLDLGDSCVASGDIVLYFRGTGRDFREGEVRAAHSCWECWGRAVRVATAGCLARVLQSFHHVAEMRRGLQATKPESC